MAKFEALPKAVKPKDLTGLQFGNLIVLDFSHRQRTEYATRIFWNCKCDCGSIRQVQTYHLTNNEVKSCGKCVYSKINRRNASPNRLPEGEGHLRAFFKGYKSNAKTKNRLFAITYDDFKVLVKYNCHYCNDPPVARVNKKAGNGFCAAHGLDRIDSKKPYTLDNVVTCCSHCNTMKLDLSYDEFKAHIKKIALHLSL